LKTNTKPQGTTCGFFICSENMDFVAATFKVGYFVGLCVDKRHTRWYKYFMRVFNWNKDKDKELKEQRGISFKEVSRLLEDGIILDDYKHPNQLKYPGQKVYAVLLRGYVYLVPYVETGDVVFLKTIIPSRKAYRKYKKGEQNEKKI
jgi:hypothetical protein